MGYGPDGYRLERGDVWRHAGPVGWWRIQYCTMPGYPDEQGGPGFAVHSTSLSGRWQRMGGFYCCRDTAGFLRMVEEEHLFFVGQWKGDARTGYDRNPKAAAMVRESVEPLLFRCERDGLLLRPYWSGKKWMRPWELRECHARGEHLYGPKAYEVVSPAQQRAWLQGHVAEEQAKLDAFEAWLRESAR